MPFRDSLTTGFRANRDAKTGLPRFSAPLLLTPHTQTRWILSPPIRAYNCRVAGSRSRCVRTPDDRPSLAIIGQFWRGAHDRQPTPLRAPLEACQSSIDQSFILVGPGLAHMDHKHPRFPALETVQGRGLDLGAPHIEAHLFPVPLLMR